MAERRAVVLSPSLWSALPAERRSDRRLLPFEYRITEPSWPEVSGPPFHQLRSRRSISWTSVTPAPLKPPGPPIIMPG